MTAIEWILQQMDLQTISKYDKQLVEAKEMEKQQIINAFNQGYRIGESDDGVNKKDIAEYSDAEYYYNEVAEKK